MDQIITIRMRPDELSELVEQAVTRALQGNGRDRPAQEPEELWGVQEAAAFLKLAVPTVYTMVSRGELPVMKRSRRLYFSRADLTEYLKKGRRISWRDVLKA